MLSTVFKVIFWLHCVHTVNTIWHLGKAKLYKTISINYTANWFAKLRGVQHYKGTWLVKVTLTSKFHVQYKNLKVQQYTYLKTSNTSKTRAKLIWNVQRRAWPLFIFNNRFHPLMVISKIEMQSIIDFNIYMFV